MTLSRKLAQVIVEKNVKVTDVVELLRTYNLLSLLPSVLKAVKQARNNEKAKDTIAIESPFALSEKSIARIKRVVGNDIAEHSVSLNKELLSGFRARFREKLYDASAERIINQLLTTN